MTQEYLNKALKQVVFSRETIGQFQMINLLTNAGADINQMYSKNYTLTDQALKMFLVKRINVLTVYNLILNGGYSKYFMNEMPDEIENVLPAIFENLRENTPKKEKSFFNWW